MRALRRLLVAIALTATTAVESADLVFGQGAHEELSQRVNHAQNLEYARILASFDDHLRRNPNDEIAAIERCRFIDVFADSESSENEQAIADSEACHESIASGPLSSTRNAQLFTWESEWGEEGIAKGNALLTKSGPWNREQLTKLHESLSLRYRNVDVLKSGDHALNAVNLDPSSSTRLFAAQHLFRIGARAQAVDMIQAMPADQWQAWTLRTALGTLLDMGEPRRALDLLQTHSEFKVDAATRARLAAALHSAGSSEEAQKLMQAIALEPSAGLGGQATRREIFEFQLGNGSEADAVNAYRALRESGYDADPYGHFRLSLLVRHPTAPWRADEWLGIGALACFLLLLALLPLIVIAPMHYWSLMCRVRGKGDETMDQSWGFGHLWYALGVLSVAGGIATYLFAYDQFHDWFGFAHGSSPIVDDRELGRAYACAQLLTFLGLLPLVLRKGLKARLLGTWSFAQSVCTGIGVAFLLLMVAAVLNVVTKPAIALGGDTIRAMQGIYGLYGAGGLLLVTSVAAPLLEEFVFRGIFLRTAMRHVRFWIAAGLQAIVFVALHDQVGAFSPLLALAVAAAWLAWRSGGLVAPIALHVTNNVMAALAIMGVTRSLSAVAG